MIWSGLGLKWQNACLACWTPELQPQYCRKGKKERREKKRNYLIQLVSMSRFLLKIVLNFQTDTDSIPKILSLILFSRKKLMTLRTQLQAK
jgi:hypothetical protein